jgi:hypothetical protein
MRTKIVVLDDMKLRIAALNLDQVDEYLIPVEVKDDSVKAAVEAHKEKTYAMICQSLNNAAERYPEENAGEPNPWTDARIRKEFDLSALYFFQTEILKFSGLSTDKKPEGGESGAELISEK